MPRWVRFADHSGATGFGTLEDDNLVSVCSGDMFEAPRATGQTVALADVSVLTPCTPSKFVGLWNNFRAAAARQGNAIPEEPLYFLKAPGSYLAHGGTIRRPATYAGRVVYEGELGIVIGRHARDLDEPRAAAAIFGYTCVNDVTAHDVLNRDPAFPQWARAKSFDTFGVFGPAIATGLNPDELVVRTLVDGKERQNYPASDMIFSPRALVSRISRELTLEPGDVIACGTSLGAGVMRPGCVVEVAIDGIGVLRNALE